MNGRTQISRGARRAMLVLGLIFFLAIVFALGKCVMSLGNDRILQASGHHYKEIAQVGDETMHLEQESIGAEIHQWTQAGKGSHIFKVEDAVFQPGSAAPTPDGSVQIARLAKLLNANPKVTADIWIPSSVSGQQLSLLQARAQALRKELLADGVSGLRIRSGAGETPQTKEAAIFVTLSTGNG